MLFGTTRLKPRRAASASHVDRRSRCRQSRRSRAAARRLRPRDRQPIVIAPQRRGVTQQKVRDQHRHRAAHVRVGRHQRRRRRARPDRRAPRRARGASPAAAESRRRRYRRRSTDTCSLRERPVCSRRPASPMRATSWRSTKLCTSSSSPVDPRRIAPSLLENRGEPVANRVAVVARSARRTRPAPRPTRDCRSRRLRRAGDRTGTRRRSRTRPDPARHRTAPTRDAGSCLTVERDHVNGSAVGSRTELLSRRLEPSAVAVRRAANAVRGTGDRRRDCRSARRASSGCR